MAASDESAFYCPTCKTTMVLMCPACTVDARESDAADSSFMRFVKSILEKFRKKDQPAQSAPPSTSAETDKTVNVGRCKTFNLVSVDVVHQSAENDSSQPPTPGVTPDTVHVNIGSADHLTVQAVTVNVDLKKTVAEIQHLTGPEINKIQQAVQEGVILAQVKWGSEAVQKYKKKYKQEKQRGVDSKAWFEDQICSLEAQIRLEQDAGDMELERVKEETKEQIKHISGQLSKALSKSDSEKRVSDLIAKLAQQQKTSEEQVSKLQLQKQEKEEQLAALKECYEQEKQREQDKVMRFVLKLEDRDQTVLRQLAVGMDTERLLRVTEHLFNEHDIRLTGVDCGLRFLMEVPTSRWSHVIEQQLEIQATLNQALPTLMQSATNNWSDVTQCSKDDVDIQLGKPVNLKVDRMTARQRVFSFIPKTADDREEPLITSIVSPQHGTLVMTDFNNRKVKEVKLNSPHTVTASITLDETPWCLALLEDGLAATTTDGKVIYLLRRVIDKITVASRVKTGRVYSGIAGHSDGTLIVSCTAGVARVDVIDRRGRCLKTIVASNTITELHNPEYLCTVGSHVLVSDLYTHTVYRLSVTDGAVLDTLKHTDMKQPSQVCVDKADNIYIASKYGQCVLVRSGTGEMRHLLYTGQHREGEDDYELPLGVCITSTGVLIVAWSGEMGFLSDSIVIGYELK